MASILALEPLAPPQPGPAPFELTIVLPTFNEAQNIAPILQRLDAALRGVAWEAVFVDDDSSDGTAASVRAAAASFQNARLIRRIGRRGLSSAVIEGALSSMAPYIAVMDADMQHDEALLAHMLADLRAGACDIVIGTRYADGGGVGDWSGRRMSMSRLATALAHRITGTKLSDPMSGYFMITREALDGAVRRVSGRGFKILLDIIASAPAPLRVRERPYEFRERQFGDSKLDSAVALEYLLLLLDKTTGRYVPTRFVMFAAVGGVGVVWHMAVLALANQALLLPFAFSQSAATVTAMTFNFFLNNALTYRDRRLKGARELFRGLLSFYAVCSLGAVANVGIASVMFTNHYSWWLAGIAGTLVGAVWNYAAASVFTWRGAR